jgi:hypothetical protein
MSEIPVFIIFFTNGILSIEFRKSKSKFKERLPVCNETLIQKDF